MMTIRASCPTCGDVEFGSEAVTVRVCTADSNGSYAFQCPECGMAVAKPADQRVVDLLKSSGAKVEVWSLPAELGEQHVGPPITYDDILEFHYLIQQDGWFDRLVGGVPFE
jgi:rRNA maturation protein Nop10